MNRTECIGSVNRFIEFAKNAGTIEKRAPFHFGLFTLSAYVFGYGLQYKWMMDVNQWRGYIWRTTSIGIIAWFLGILVIVIIAYMLRNHGHRDSRRLIRRLDLSMMPLLCMAASPIYPPARNIALGMSLFLSAALCFILLYPEWKDYLRAKFPPPIGDVTVKETRDCYTIVLRGKVIEANTRDLFELIALGNETIDQPKVLIDCRDITEMDGRGLLMILTIAAWALLYDRRICLNGEIRISTKRGPVTLNESWLREYTGF